MGAAGSFPGGCCRRRGISAAFEEKSLFSFCLLFASLCCGMQGAGGEDRSAAACGLAEQERAVVGESCPLEVHNFSLLPLCSSGFLPNEL